MTTSDRYLSKVVCGDSFRLPKGIPEGIIDASIAETAFAYEISEDLWISWCVGSSPTVRTSGTERSHFISDCGVPGEPKCHSPPLCVCWNRPDFTPISLKI